MQPDYPLSGSQYPYNLALAFESTVTSGPDRIALRFSDGAHITYEALNARANRVARRLLKMGVGRHDVVAIFQNKSLDGFATMLACLKIGAIYTNLDDQNPPDRLEKILANCKPRIIAGDMPATPAVDAAAAAVQARLVDLGGLADPGEDASNLEAAWTTTGEDPAYLMFTSGSTGMPKGAVISHGGVLNLIRWSISRFGIAPGDVLTNVNPIYFDNSVFDFYSALFSGASLFPVPRDLLKAPRQLIDAVNRQGCTLWFSVPSMLIYLNTVKALTASDFPAMKTIAFGGEGYPKSELKKLYGLFSSRMRLVNVYGPTECTCICSAYDIGERDFDDMNGLPPLGRLCPNFDYAILDQDDKPVPDGTAGELCLLGPNVGLGYYADPERTAASFVTHPLNRNYPERMYRSGDLVKINPATKLIEFVGRKDNQIKHQGYRIELEEIEAALHRLPYVIQCGVVYHRIRAEFGEIVAFVAAEGAPGENAVRDDLRALVPDYMVPRKITLLPDLPKNANGKVDRQALKKMLSER